MAVKRNVTMVPASCSYIPTRARITDGCDEFDTMGDEDNCRLSSIDSKGMHRFYGTCGSRVIRRPYTCMTKSKTFLAAVWCCIVAFAPAAACSRSDDTSGSGGAEAVAVPTAQPPHARMANCTKNEEAASQCVYGTCYVTELDGRRSQPACQCQPLYTGAKCKIKALLPSVHTDAASLYIALPIVVIVVVAVIMVLVVCRIRRGRWNLCSTSESRTAGNTPTGTSHLPPTSHVPSNGVSEADTLLSNGNQGSPNGDQSARNVEINTNSVTYKPNFAESQ